MTCASARPWSAVVDGALRRRALDAARRIARGLRGDDVDDGSLLEGQSGIALFHAYLAAAEQSDPTRALALLQAAAGRAAQAAPSLSLGHGVVGVAWAMRHVSAVLDAEVCTRSLDAWMLAVVSRAHGTEPFDLVSGFAGIGVYALEARPDAVARSLLERVVELLGQRASMTSAGVSWWTAAGELDGDLAVRHYNLGMAHGAAGVIAMLARAKMCGQCPPEGDQLLRAAVTMLRAQRLPAGASSAFPAATDGRRRSAFPRVGWCYGDLGIAVALLHAARAYDDSTLWSQAMGIGLAAAERDDVDGLGLCHGAAGAAHSFRRLLQATGHPAFERAAQRWLQRLLEQGEQQAPGLLDGRAGVGLALLAAATDLEPAWDRLLLLAPGP